MNNIKLSVVIPSYADPLIHPTIDSLLSNSQLGDALEIIVVLDGRWPVTPIKNDKRVRVLHRGSNGGMRESINSGMAIARGEFVGRMDEHCLLGPGYDKILTDDCLHNTVISPRRYFLDPVKWKVMEELGYVDYERLVIQSVGNVRKFAGQKWISRTKERKDIMVDENQAIQGSFWVAPKKIWDDVLGGELRTDIFGPTYQDSVEICMANWKAGGKLLITKNTFYAHKHRSFPRVHQEGSPENPSNREASWTASLNMFEDYYKNTLLPMWENK